MCVCVYLNRDIVATEKLNLSASRMIPALQRREHTCVLPVCLGY
jgi:hypothetical protein